MTDSPNFIRGNGREPVVTGIRAVLVSRHKNINRRENVFTIRVVRVVLPTVLFAGLFGVRDTHAQSADVQAVTAANTAFYAALSARDATAMSKVYAHDDFVMVVSPNGKPEGPGWPAVEAWAKSLATLYTQLEVKPSDPHVHINGSVAWVVTTEHVSFKQTNGQQHDLTITATNIFEKTGDRWLMTQHQPTPIAK
jgi:ketosteroid isomerase-like protein